MKIFVSLALVAVLAGVALRSGMAQTVEGGAKAQRQTLEQPRDIDGYPCAKGYAWFYADGRLERCSVSRETTFGEAQAPAQSILVLLQDGRPRLAMLQHDAEIAGVKCRGGSWLGPGEGASTAFYPSGRLKGCFLAEDEIVQGAPCKASWFFSRNAGVKFFENGKLESCTLAKDFGGQRRGERMVRVP